MPSEGERVPLDYGSVESYSDRGFGFVTCTLWSSGSTGTTVFFHIKTVRRKYPQLADKLDNGSHYGVSFWYDTQSTHKGDQVKDIWLKIDEIPEPQLGEARVRVEQFWQDTQHNLLPGIEALSQQLLDRVKYEKLSQERERILRAQREAEAEKRRSEEEQRRKAQIEAQERRLAEEPHRTAEAEEWRPTEEWRLVEEQLRAEELHILWRRFAEEERSTAETWRTPASHVQPPRTVPPPFPPGPSTPPQSDAQTGYFYQQFSIASGSRATSSQVGPRQIETKVVGVTYENRQSVVRQLAVNEQVWLRREPSNSYDRNAIRVERQNGQQIGYISRAEAAMLATSFDAHGKPVSAIVMAIVTGYSSYSALGVRIRFTVPETAGPKRPLIPDFDDNWEL
jgi:cold shock CspA family protein